MTQTQMTRETVDSSNCFVPLSSLSDEALNQELGFALGEFSDAEDAMLFEEEHFGGVTPETRAILNDARAYLAAVDAVAKSRGMVV